MLEYLVPVISLINLKYFNYLLGYILTLAALVKQISCDFGSSDNHKYLRVFLLLEGGVLDCRNSAVMYLLSCLSRERQAQTGLRGIILFRLPLIRFWRRIG